MELSKFAAEYAGSESGVELTEFSAVGRRLVEHGMHFQSAAALIATMFWRAWLASDIAPAFLAVHSSEPGAIARSRTIIVPRPDLARFDLVILDPAIKPGTPPRAMGAILASGAMSDILMRGAVRAAVDVPLADVGVDAVVLAVEAMTNPKQPWWFVIAPEPQQERLSVPSNPHTVNDGAGQVSTAGVLVEDATLAGRFGVTAALHGVDGATAVTVAGHAATIIRTDTVTDSAFIEVALGHVPTTTVRGALSGMAPRGNQNAVFAGHQSGTKNTVISGWDAQVPNPSARRQACVYTRRDAQNGDSGSALVTDDDWIAGFAFERSKLGEVPAQCAWIWADSVLNRLQVKLV